MRKIQAVFVSAITALSFAVAGISPAHAVTCPAGTVSSGVNQCITTPSNVPSYQDTFTGTPTYSCVTGVLSGSKCLISAVTQLATSTNLITCNSGDIYTANSCQHTTTVTYPAISTTTSACPVGPGLGQYGSLCYSSISGLWSNPVSTTTYSCDINATLVDTTCYFYPVSFYNPTSTISYSCPTGYTLSGSTCTLPSSIVDALATYPQSCPVHYVLNVAGSCDAIAFTPVLYAPFQQWTCVTTNYDGSQNVAIYTHDASYSGVYFNISCSLVQVSSSPVTGNYLCVTSSNTGKLNNFISATDISGSTDSEDTYCFYTGDVLTQPDLTPVLDTSTSTSSLFCSNISDWGLFVVCENSY